MERGSVIVFGARGDESLGNVLHQLGLGPIFCETVHGAVEKLRRGGCLAIVVDCDQAKVDLLELTLNARDMDERIPIILAGRLPDPGLAKVIASRPGTYLVEQREMAEQLQQLLHVVAAYEEKHG